jgi:alkylation response protein AidB-like acyl-CoA dehydrogenase
MNDVPRAADGPRAPPGAASADAGPWLERVAGLASLIEAAAPAAERERRLPDPVVAALHGAGLLRLLLPRDFGGAEVSPPAFLRVIEALARLDASTAWCVCQGNGCAMTAAYLAPHVADAIWGRDPRALVAWGPGKTRAEVVDGGYSVTASCAFASGGRHATWFGAHCPVVERDGTPRRRPDGSPEVRTVLFPAGLAPMTDIWDVIGLRGTGSDAYAVDGLFVREDHTTVREAAEFLRCRGPLYLFPQMALYAIGFSATALGIARAFVDAFLALARDKRPRLAATVLRDNAAVQDEVARGEARLSAARALLVTETERVWAEVLASGELTVAQRMRIRLAGTHGIHEAKTVVDVLYDTAGTTAIFASSPFERRFRDMHTVVQQLQGRKSHFQTVGAWLLGHPPDLSVI